MKEIVAELVTKIMQLEVEKLKITEDRKNAIKALGDEAWKAGRAQAALEFLGLPDLSDPNFDAQVTHTAWKLGLLTRKS